MGAAMQLSDLLPHLVLLLGGTLATSIGLGPLFRSARGRSLLERTTWRGMTTLVLGFLGISAGGLYAVWRLSIDRLADLTPSPSTLLIVGLLVGLPLSLPTAIGTWSEVRRARRREAPATRDDRREYAGSLAKQIREVSEGQTNVSAQVGGDGGRVLQLDGDLDSRKGERLVAALRTELKDLGFKRVEGRGPGGKWWTRV